MVIDRSNYSLVREMYSSFRESSIKKQTRIRRNRWNFGGCVPEQKLILIRRNILPSEEEITLLHEGLHNIGYKDEEDVEATAVRIHMEMSQRQKRRLRRFIPED